MESVGLRPIRATFAPLCPTGPKPKTRRDQQNGEQQETTRTWVGTEVPKFSGRSHGVARSTSVNEPRGRGAVNERERVAILGIPPLNRPPDLAGRKPRRAEILAPPGQGCIRPLARSPYRPLAISPHVPARSRRSRSFPLVSRGDGQYEQASQQNGLRDPIKRVVGFFRPVAYCTNNGRTEKTGEAAERIDQGHTCRGPRAAQHVCRS